MVLLSAHGCSHPWQKNHSVTATSKLLPQEGLCCPHLCLQQAKAQPRVLRLGSGSRTCLQQYPNSHHPQPGQHPVPKQACPGPGALEQEMRLNCLQTDPAPHCEAAPTPPSPPPGPSTAPHTQHHCHRSQRCASQGWPPWSWCRSQSPELCLGKEGKKKTNKTTNKQKEIVKTFSQSQALNSFNLFPHFDSTLIFALWDSQDVSEYRLG